MSPIWTFKRVGKGSNTFDVRYQDVSKGIDIELPDVTVSPVSTAGDGSLKFKNKDFSFGANPSYAFSLGHFDKGGTMIETDTINILTEAVLPPVQVTGLIDEPIAVGLKSPRIIWDAAHIADPTITHYHFYVNAQYHGTAAASSLSFLADDPTKIYYEGTITGGMVSWPNDDNSHLISVTAGRSADPSKGFGKADTTWHEGSAWSFKVLANVAGDNLDITYDHLQNLGVLLGNVQYTYYITGPDNVKHPRGGNGNPPGDGATFTTTLTTISYLVDTLGIAGYEDIIKITVEAEEQDTGTTLTKVVNVTLPVDPSPPVDPPEEPEEPTDPPIEEPDPPVDPPEEGEYPTTYPADDPTVISGIYVSADGPRPQHMLRVSFNSLHLLDPSVTHYHIYVDGQFHQTIEAPTDGAPIIEYQDDFGWGEVPWPEGKLMITDHTVGISAATSSSRASEFGYAEGVYKAPLEPIENFEVELSYGLNWFDIKHKDLVNAGALSEPMTYTYEYESASAGKYLLKVRDGGTISTSEMGLVYSLSKSDLTGKGFVEGEDVKVTITAKETDTGKSMTASASIPLDSSMFDNKITGISIEPEGYDITDPLIVTFDAKHISDPSVTHYHIFVDKDMYKDANLYQVVPVGDMDSVSGQPNKVSFRGGTPIIDSDKWPVGLHRWNNYKIGIGLSKSSHPGIMTGYEDEKYIANDPWDGPTVPFELYNVKSTKSGFMFIFDDLLLQDKLDTRPRLDFYAYKKGDETKTSILSMAASRGYAPSNQLFELVIPYDAFTSHGFANGETVMLEVRAMGLYDNKLKTFTFSREVTLNMI